MVLCGPVGLAPLSQAFADYRAFLKYRTLVDGWIVVGLGVVSPPWGCALQEIATFA